MDREALGEFWLRWYVHRSDPRRIITAIERDHADALQLRVRDVEDDRVRAALRQPDPAHPEQNHLDLIERYESRYGEFSAVAFIAPAWATPEGPVLRDGGHRACALYRLNPPKLDADVVLSPAPEGHLDVLPGLRRSRP